MAHRSKKNKRHIPRDVGEMMFATASRLANLPTNCDLPDIDHVEHISRQLAAARQRLQFGGVTHFDLSNLQDAVNVALKLITDDNFPEALIATKAAELALICIDERYTERKTWIARSAELEALDNFLPLHDAILGNSPHIEIEHATAAVRRDMEVRV